MAGHGSDIAAWPSGIEAITLFVEDLDAAKTFYGDVFGLPVRTRTTPLPSSVSAKRWSTC